MEKKREERSVTIAMSDAERALEGLFIAGVDDAAAGIVIAPPHPLYGGSMDSPVVNEVAYASRRAGLASLRFNWRGVGASAGVPSGAASDADADYRAALLHLTETVPGIVIAAGYSFGAAAAVRVARGEQRVRRLLLIAPPPPLLDAEALAAFPGEVLVIAGTEDSFAPAAELERMTAGLERGTFAPVPRADHFFAVGLAEIARVVTRWLGA